VLVHLPPAEHLDRVLHTKTGGGHEKVETYKDMGVALAKFQSLRATMIAYIKSTDDDLRAHSFGKKRTDRFLAVDAGNLYARRETHSADSGDQERSQFS
jgi:hypothetical protein